MRIGKIFSGFLAMMVMGFLGQPAFASENSSAQSRTLIIWFSQPEEMKPDAIDGFSGASVLQKYTPETGSTQFVAQLIQKQTHGDLFRLETATPYPRQHDALLRVAEKEQQTQARPSLKTPLPDLSDYDTIYVGYPIWWYTMPMVIYSLFEQNDFAGKTVIPFTTHGGSRLADSLREIARMQPQATLVTRALSISRNDISGPDVPAQVEQWVKQVQPQR
ncbi:flavodoxin [Salmonella enterica]|nr:flavodoxin [Salmonella enterica]EBV5295726.1 flavodoxin [Salmonella enterica subsp. enterica serovar Sandiego]ECS6189182.1 flavodoxin [Salmonella enterica subsp. enterica serovar Enteritidis]EEB3718912.1 flavodoxin [Salmonella enterica subsp. enterica serovar Panama]EEH4251341.1 flavodoxin [Salmonella enterica subsp. enterica serovar Montevideo]HCI5682808.1 flavodoxin [Klebsiella variicola subsp. variicola]